MTGDYFYYILAAYTVCFVVLVGVTLSTLLAWKKHK